MHHAFVFGKFLPFHKGHEAMIRFAQEHCRFLTVLICCSDREDIPGGQRQDWIAQSFPDAVNLEIKVFAYKESEFPNTSVSSREVSALWACLFEKILPGVDGLVSSEPYGDFVAEFMKIKHLPFDLERRHFPVSASSIRRALSENWHFLPDAVRPWYARKVVLLGTESTGKSTLAVRLARHFSCGLVRECARELIADSKDFSFRDLERVAEAQAREIQKVLLAEGPLLILDTDIHLTASYAQFVFGRELSVREAIWAANKADLYLYLCADAPYIQDGTRLDEVRRNALDLSHRALLQKHGIAYTEIRGDWDQRFEQAVEAITPLC